MSTMLARIEFEDNYGYREDDPNNITHAVLEQLESDLGEKVKAEQLVHTLSGDDKGYVGRYASYRHRFKEDEEDSDKDLVEHINLYKLGDGKEYLVRLDVFLEKYPALKIKVRGTPRIAMDNSPSVAAERLIEKIENMEDRFDQSVEFNDKCEVHVPNLGLLSISEVTYVEDCCTDQLQSYLEGGWRIIAACPQPNQRRPDYILGRNKEIS